jgi:quercetin dioxygenase-like cupin family protein
LLTGELQGENRYDGDQYGSNVKISRLWYGPPRRSFKSPTLRYQAVVESTMEIVQHSARETVEAVDGVHLTQLAVGEEMSVQHFHIEPGATVPEHSHHHEQVGFIVQGTLAFEVDGEEHVVGPGDSYVIPGGEPHSAENRSEEPVSGIDVFSPPRANPDWMD